MESPGVCCRLRVYLEISRDLPVKPSWPMSSRLSIQGIFLPCRASVFPGAVELGLEILRLLTMKTISTRIRDLWLDHVSRRSARAIHLISSTRWLQKHSGVAHHTGLTYSESILLKRVSKNRLIKRTLWGFSASSSTRSKINSWARTCSVSASVLAVLAVQSVVLQWILRVNRVF